jgi:methionine sulfoxide reductase heme-binding subunit
MDRPAARVLLHFACSIPFAWLVYLAVEGGLGPDPAESIMHTTGEWTLRLLALSLLISPLKQWLRSPWMHKLRRPAGLWAFFYSVLHLMTFAHFFIGWTPAILLEELVERPYITVGFLAFLLLLPMAVTSTRGMQRRLKRNWVKLHTLVYPAALLACIHLWWLSRSDVGEALVYIVVVVGLLSLRVRRTLLVWGVTPR